jgi:hypothetical protein
MEQELNALLDECPADLSLEIRYLDQQLHRVPEKMPAVIQQEIEHVAPYADDIVLGYGLCSNGIVGVSAPRQPLCVPKVHDCVALLLGSRQAYREAFNERAGTYYITPGWVKEKKDPLGILETEYIPRLGREDAVWGLKEELKHYSHIALIETHAGDVERLRQRARENALFLEKEYAEVKGSPDYFRRILFGPHEEPEFLCLPPGEPVRQKPFLS